MRIKDPRLTDGMRDERLSRTRCMTTRAPRHRWGVLSCKASSNVWCGGDHGASQGRVSSWNGSSGELQCSVLLESSARCIAVVETVRPASALRSAPAARGKGAPDGFGCELLVWVGLADGRLAVLTAATVQLRAVLSGHRAPVTCVCSPGAPPSSPGPGASIVLSGSEDSSMRLWDARTADCLRSIPGNGFALRAMAPVWSPDGERERCRIWSTAADQTLCIWEPRPKGEGKAVGPHTVTLNADVFELSASSDGRLVCACAGRDGAMVLDASARLRSRPRVHCLRRLLSTHMAERALGAVLVIGKGKQIWTSGGEGGLAQWERTAASSSHEVWGAACDGTLFAWASEAACAEACEAAARRALLGSEGSAELQQRALAYPMLRLLRQARRVKGRGAEETRRGGEGEGALAELSGQRDFMSSVLAGLSEGWSAIEAQRRAVLQAANPSFPLHSRLPFNPLCRAEVGVPLGVQWDKKVHLRLQAEAAKCRAADAEAAKLRADVSALRERLAGAGLEKQQVLTMKAAKEMEVSRLKKVEASLAQRAKHEQELARQLADARVRAAARRALVGAHPLRALLQVQTEKLRSERDKLQASAMPPRLSSHASPHAPPLTLSSPSPTLSEPSPPRSPNPLLHALLTLSSTLSSPSPTLSSPSPNPLHALRTLSHALLTLSSTLSSPSPTLS
ncbi:hypothetical protein AB1Y20_022224 [Prymnesium parvum]|uniref:Uncharacterized protein n=1 Tax=Prymnesium parvum TaxID=97485 RepID=A0AB34JHS0_PRYPA